MLRVFFLCALLAISVSAEEAPTTVLNLVQLSDIHSGGPHFSEVAFREACQQGLALHPQGVLLTGDNGDNSHDKAGFDTRLRHDLGLWREALSGYSGQVFMAPGNDDFGHNYQTEPADLRATALAFQQSFGSRYYLNELGNGLSPSQLGGFRWLTVNSQIFSPLNHTPQAPDQAQATFQWLRGQLQAGQGPVVLLCHVPPSWDLYIGKPGWRPEYLRQLADIMDEYADPVLMICGHLHRNHVQAMRPDRPIPILTGGALATKYGYHSNWRDYRWLLQPGLGIQELTYTVHYTQHPQWTAQCTLRPDRLQDFLERLEDESQFYREYLRNLYANHSDWSKWADDDMIRQRVLREFWVDPEADS